MDGAAANGHLEVVRWLHNNRLEGCTTKAMEGAALNGHWKLCSGCIGIDGKGATLPLWTNWLENA